MSRVGGGNTHKNRSLCLWVVFSQPVVQGALGTQTATTVLI